MRDIESCTSSISSELCSVEKERDRMLHELAGLDEQSKKLLEEQTLLENEVSVLELQLNSVNVIKEVNQLMNRKDVLITDFAKFSTVVKSLALVEGDPRQYEHLKSRVCSIALSVGTAAVDAYSKRMLDFIDSLEGSSVSSVSLFGKFTETLLVVSKISALFRSKGREFFQAVIELEKLLCDARERISIPVIGAYISSITVASSLSISMRKTIYFANSIGKQELNFFESIFSSSQPSDSVQALLRSIGLALYQPLRTAVIACEDLSELRESAEIIRLEILSSENSEFLPFVQSVAFKLHRDVQERLIYKTEAFIRDSIRGAVVADCSNDPEPVVKTFECLALITGVVDSQTLHDMANQAVNACVDSLMSVRASSVTDNALFLIHQLLSLRERIALIDCDFGGQESVGITDTLRRLVRVDAKRAPEVAVRQRIELELKSLCDALTASVVASVLTASSPEEKSAVLSSVTEKIKLALKNEGLENILLRPILAELERPPLP